MASKSILFLTLIFLISCSIQYSYCQNGTVIWIESPRETNWGTWGEEEFCPDDQFVYGFRLKVQPDMGWIVDDTAVNAIELLCLPFTQLGDEGEVNLAPFPIRSKEGPQGSWGTVFECPAPLFADGFQLNIESPTAFDNTATNNLRLRCSDGSLVTGVGHNWGDWTGLITCPRGMLAWPLRRQYLLKKLINNI